MSEKMARTSAALINGEPEAMASLSGLSQTVMHWFMLFT
jgi:hypothetical protein